MQEVRYPFFQKDRILKIGMLENLRDFPREVLHCCYENFSDGILWGVSPIVDEIGITVTKGLFRYQGEICLLSKAVRISYGETEGEVLLKLQIHDITEEADYKKWYVNIFLDSQKELAENEWELGRFCLKKGAYLRQQYQDLQDFTTQYNTMNIVSVNYAGREVPTISMEILRYFAKEILPYATESIDQNFCLLCMNQERIQRQTILWYIAKRQKQKFEHLSNIEIHKALLHIEAEVKEGRYRGNQGRISMSKIWVE